MYVHCDCWHCTLQRRLSDTSTCCPRVLRLRCSREHRTPLGTVCVLLVLSANNSRRGHDGGHEMRARVCARQSEMLPLCEDCVSETRVHWKFTHHRPLSLPQNQRPDSPWNGPTMSSGHTLQTSLGQIAKEPTFRARILQIGHDCFRSRPL